MVGRPRRDAAVRIDPKSGAALPEGIRYRDDKDRYQVRVIVRLADGSWGERAPTFQTLAQAKRARADAVSRSFQSSAMTLEAWHSQHWAAIEASVRPGTARGYDVAWRLRVRPSLGHVKLSDLVPTRIEEAMARWSGSASTKIDALSLLSRLLDAARRARLVDFNSALDVARPRDDFAEDPASLALSSAEVNVVLSMIPEGHYRRYAAGLTFTGARAGELTASRVLDVSPDVSSLAIGRSYSPGRTGELILQGTKGHNVRHAPIADRLRPYVVEAMRGKRPTDLLFDGVRGGRLSVGTFRRAVEWDAIRAELGRPDLKVKDLRHTFATLLFDGGAAANDVKDAMGHSSLQVTEIYTRARADVARRAGDALNRALDGTNMAPNNEAAPNNETERSVRTR